MYVERKCRVNQKNNNENISQVSTVSNSEQSGSVQIAGKGGKSSSRGVHIDYLSTHLTAFEAVDAAITRFLTKETAEESH
jgi:hypothetical protein